MKKIVSTCLLLMALSTLGRSAFALEDFCGKAHLWCRLHAEYGNPEDMDARGDALDDCDRAYIACKNF